MEWRHGNRELSRQAAGIFESSAFRTSQYDDSEMFQYFPESVNAVWVTLDPLQKSTTRRQVGYIVKLRAAASDSNLVDFYTTQWSRLGYLDGDGRLYVMTGNGLSDQGAHSVLTAANIVFDVSHRYGMDSSLFIQSTILGEMENWRSLGSAARGLSVTETPAHTERLELDDVGLATHLQGLEKDEFYKRQRVIYDELRRKRIGALPPLPESPPADDNE